MKKKCKKLHLSNEGFSLMELIVTMLVSAVVTAAAAGFLVAGVQFYNRANAETIVQKESQVAELFITELIQEAVDYTYFPETACPSGVDSALKITRRDDSGNDVISIVARKGDMLWYAQADTSLPDDVSMISDVASKNKSVAFLADCVTYFNVLPDKKGDADTNGLVQLILQFEEANKTYSSNAIIALRNKKRN